MQYSVMDSKSDVKEEPQNMAKSSSKSDLAFDKRISNGSSNEITLDAIETKDKDMPLDEKDVHIDESEQFQLQGTIFISLPKTF